MFTEFRHDLQEIDSLQQEFDGALGIKKKKDGPILSHNPVLDRWHAQNLQEGEEESFRYHELQQLKTMLSERYQVMAYPITYRVDSNGDIYHQELPKEPFLKILQRGQAYRIKVGSKEGVREEKEIEGWLKVFETLSAENVTTNAKMAVISGPGLVEDTAYPHNFVDIFTKQDDGSVVMTRFSSSNDYDSYARIATDQYESYFENFKGPLDAWFLNNPIKVDSDNTKKSAEEVFKELFGKSNDVINQKDFEKIIAECMPVIQFYINILCDMEFKPQELAVAFNAIVNSADNEKKKLKYRKTAETEKIVYYNFEEVKQKVNDLGHQPVQSISAGCGLSSGFVLNNILLVNSVARFGVKQEDDDPLEFKCQNGHWNRREPGKYKKYCDTCHCDVSCGIASAA